MRRDIADAMLRAIFTRNACLMKILPLIPARLPSADEQVNDAFADYIMAPRFSKQDWRDAAKAVEALK